ncbi:hypothetical protein LTR66_017072, partial [Elasticomyces elasticus]
MATDGKQIINIDNTEYLLWPTKVSLKPGHQRRLRLSKFDHDFIAITAITWDKSTFGKDELEDVCHQYEKADDVWCRSFLQLIVLLQPSQIKCVTSSKRIFTIQNQLGFLPQGPLTIEKATGQIFHVAKLEMDTHAAFCSSVWPSLTRKTNFKEFCTSEYPQVPLPSRLYFPEDKDKPLNGVRIAVKDNIVMKGLKTSFGSQAWLETYPAEHVNAPCVQKLMDAGAVIVGKVKTSEFAEGVSACEWSSVCPINPRGDAFQQTSSSSTGSASAAAAYNWLDVTIGTDTGGSIRHPAGVNGLYGQRPSTGSMDIRGVLGATELFNTVGIFARDVKTFSKVGGFMVDTEQQPRVPAAERKFNLLYPTRAPNAVNPDPHHGGQHRWFPHPEVNQGTWTEAEKNIEQVVSRMEKLLGCKRIPFNINELWRATPVIGQPKSLDEAVGHIYSTITTSSACQTGIDTFLGEYAAQNDGAVPKMSEVVSRRLAHGRYLDTDEIAAALEAMGAFKEWTENVLFGSYDQDATTILIFPQSCGRPAYRDTVPDHSVLFNDTFSIYAFGYLVGCPDYTLPVAEVPYHSKHTGQI